jgi:hypothetical protein
MMAVVTDAARSWTSLAAQLTVLRLAKLPDVATSAIHRRNQRRFL